MTTLSLIADTPFFFDEAITDPSLRGNGRISGIGDDLVALAQDQRYALLRGTSGSSGTNELKLPPFAVLEQSGHLLAHAAIDNKAAVAEAIMLFWINTNSGIGSDPKWTIGLVGKMYDTLAASGRLDLFRPAVVLIRDVCRAVWRARTHNLKGVKEGHTPIGPALVDLIDSGELLGLHRVGPFDRARICDKRSDTYAGAVIWTTVTQGVGRLIRVNNTTEVLPALQVVSDVIRSVPETRFSVAQIFLDAGQKQHDDELWSNRAWLQHLSELAPFLEADAASEVLQRLANFVVAVRKRNIPAGVQGNQVNRVKQLAHIVIDAHPKMSWAQWVFPKTSIEVEDGREASAWSNIRAEIARNGYPDRDRMYPGSLFPEALSGYDVLAEMIGPEYGDDMDPTSHACLEQIAAYISGHSTVSLPIPFLTTALDKYKLTHGAGSADKPDETPARTENEGPVHRNEQGTPRRGVGRARL